MMNDNIICLFFFFWEREFKQNKFVENLCDFKIQKFSNYLNEIIVLNNCEKLTAVFLVDSLLFEPEQKIYICIYIIVESF